MTSEISSITTYVEKVDAIKVQKMNATEAVNTGVAVLVNDSKDTRKTTSRNSEYISQRAFRKSSRTTLNPGNVSFNGNGQQQFSRGTIKEVIHMLSTSNSLLQHSSMVSETPIWKCLRRNSSLHYKYYAHMIISFAKQGQKIESRYSHTCLLRLTAMDGQVSTVFRILYRECSTIDDKLTVYELNASAIHKPTIKELVKICNGTMNQEYNGHTNEILILIKIKHPAAFNKFFLEVASRSAHILESQYTSRTGR